MANEEEKTILEGRAVLSVPATVFFSEHQVLQRDLSVAVLRVFRRFKASGKLLRPISPPQQQGSGLQQNGVHASETGRREDEEAKIAGAPAKPTLVLRICDALAGGGVRAIRYALEAGGPVEVVANDHSRDACQAIHRSASLSGIDVALETATERFGAVDGDANGSEVEAAPLSTGVRLESATCSRSAAAAAAAMGAGGQQHEVFAEDRRAATVVAASAAAAAAVTSVARTAAPPATAEEAEEATTSAAPAPAVAASPPASTSTIPPAPAPEALPLAVSSSEATAAVAAPAAPSAAAATAPPPPPTTTVGHPTQYTEEEHTISALESSPPSHSPQPPLPRGPYFTVRIGDANTLLLSGAAGTSASNSTPGAAAAEAVSSEGGGNPLGGWDFIDVDPFGSCLPFLEAAVAGVKDGGVLAIAATDLAVLCGKKGHKRCRSQYGASVADRPYAKEAAMRLLLHRVDTLARRRSKRMVPLLCVALDFYLRLFVMIVPEESGKKLAPPHCVEATPLLIMQRLDSPEFCPFATGSTKSGAAPAPRNSPEKIGCEKNTDENGLEKILENGTENIPAAGKASGDTLFRQEPEVSSENGLENDLENSPAGCRTEVSSEKGGEEDPSAGCSAVQGRECLTLGPFWRGPLFHPDFLADTLSEVKLSRGGSAALPSPTACASAITNSSFVPPDEPQPCLAGEVAAPANTPACGGGGVRGRRRVAFGSDGRGEHRRRVKSRARGEGDRETGNDEEEKEKEEKEEGKEEQEQEQEEEEEEVEEQEEEETDKKEVKEKEEEEEEEKEVEEEKEEEEEGEEANKALVLPSWAANASAADDKQKQRESLLSGSRSACRGASVPPDTSPLSRDHKRRRDTSASEKNGSKTSKRGAEARARRVDTTTPGTIPTSTTTSPELVTLSSRRQLLFLLEALSEELLDCPLFYSLTDVADYGGGDRKRSSWSFGGEGGGKRRGGRRVTPLPNVEAVRAQLRSEGYECSGSHAEPRAIKTQAPLSAVDAAVWSAVARKTEEHRRGQRHPGSLQAARASIVPRSAASGASAGASGNGDGRFRDGAGDVGRRDGGGGGGGSDGANSNDLGGHCGGDGGNSCPRNEQRDGGCPCPRSAHRSPLLAEEDGSVAQAGPRMPVGCAPLRRPEDVLPPPSPRKGEDYLGGGTSTTQGGRRDTSHLTLASLEGFIEDTLASRAATSSETPTSVNGRSGGGDDPRSSDGDFPDLGRRDAGDTPSPRGLFCLVRSCGRGVGGGRDGGAVACRGGGGSGGGGGGGSRGGGGDGLERGNGCGDGDGGGGTGGGRRQPGGDGQREFEQMASSRWPDRVRFFDSLAEACDTASKPSQGGGDATTVVVLGGKHDAGKGGIRLSAKGMTLLGVQGTDGQLPTVEGRGVSHAITCVGSDISVRSLRVRAGASFAIETTVTTTTPTTTTDTTSAAATTANTITTTTTTTATTTPATTTAATTTTTATTTVAANRTSTITAITPAAATPTTTTTTTTATATATATAAAVASVPATFVAALKSSEAAPASAGFKRAGGARGVKPKADFDKGIRRKRPRLVFDRQAAQVVIASAETERKRATPRQNALRSARNPGTPAHAIAVERGSASIWGCDVSSALAYACVSVAGADSVATLEKTRLADGLGMGMLVCGRARAVASECSFEGMGAAGVEARGGSEVKLSRCVVSGCAKSGVFVQAFSKAWVSRCEVVRSAFAGVEAMRNASLRMDACNIVGSRRGGVLVHVASKAALRDCSVSDSRLAGVDVRTGAEAMLEACSIQGGNASGVYVSAGGSVSICATLMWSNRLAAIEINDGDDADHHGRRQHRQQAQHQQHQQPRQQQEQQQEHPRKQEERQQPSLKQEGHRQQQQQQQQQQTKTEITTPLSRGRGAGGAFSMAVSATKPVAAATPRCVCCVSLGAGNVMTANGLDGVLSAGIPATAATATTTAVAATAD